jgi:uncharacterized protein (TIGR02266 family)
MAQDTRKDPRAKVLTMTVRYKSATVDEFIEHHSHDVSRGGIFIKTPSPFLPGTLLKFEIRIADDKAMLQGVGRVVWKREPAGAGPDKPAGMGVKFIKVDEASRALIDRLVTSKGSATSAYDAESPMELGATAAAAQPPAPPQRAANPAPVGAAPVRPAGVAPVGPAIRKATMIGLGINAASATAAASTSQSPPAGKQRSVPPRPAAEPMFPKTNSELEMPPPEERTVMKQAAQLLEEALKGAGGSIDEVGAAPIQLEGPPPSKPPPSKPPASRPPASSRDRDHGREDAEPYDRTASAKMRSNEPPAPRRGETAPTPIERRPVALPRDVGPASVRPAGRPVAAAPVDSQKKSGSGGRAIISLLLVAGAAAAMYVFLQRKAPEPVVEPAAPVATTPPPAATPVVTAAPMPIEPAASAAPIAPASASAVKPGAVVAPAAVPGTPAEATPPEKPAPAAKPAAAEKPAPAEKPPVEKPAPVEKPPAAEKPAPAVAAPKPKPAKPPPEEGAPPPEKKKPAPKPADDNPY